MRPKRLVMNAFGPYAGEQVVDFAQLADDAIFVITGPTGAGKTTIFDAICFALYGGASSEYRLSEQFKSHHSSLKQICSVELTFTVGELEYTVRRVPRQMKLGRGNRLVEQLPQATLAMPDGSVLSGVQNVNAEMPAIIGLKENQFKQVVMLPQGEFRKLLEAGSGERQEIFRRIFKTGLFDRISELLNLRSREIRHRAEDAGKAMRHALDSVDAGGDDALRDLLQANPPHVGRVLAALKAGLQADGERLQTLEEKSAALEKERNALGIEEARRLHQSISRLAQVRQGLSALLEKEAQVRQGMARAARGRAAEEIRLRAARPLEETKQALEKLAARLAEERAAQQAQRTAEEAAQADLQRAGKGLRQREELTAALSRCDAALEKLREAARKQKALREAEQRAASLQVFLTKLVKIEQMLVLRQSHASLEKQAGELKALLAGTAEYRQQMQRYLAAKQNFDRMYAAYLQGQAGLLAAGLREGEPCPVCGAREHPERAVLPANVPDKQALEAAKKQAEAAQTALNTCDGRCKRLFGAVQAAFEPPMDEASLYRDVSPLEALWQRVSREYAQSQEACRQAETEVHTTIADARKLREQGYTSPEAVAADRGRYEASLQRAQAQVETLQSEFAASTQGVQEDETSVLSRQGELRRKLQELDAAYEAANRSYHAAARARAAADKGVLALVSRQDELTAQHEALHKLFAELLAARGFASQRAYEDGLCDPQEIERLEQAGRAFEREQAALRGEEKSLSEQIAGREAVDIGRLEELEQKFAAALAACREESMQLYSRVQQNRRQQDNIARLQEQTERLVVEYEQVGRLARVACGQNGRNLSFERYVLTAYFTQIIAAANLRLKRMTDSRYLLKRKEEKEKGNSASGLGLAIIDNYTGREREVGTLSGGEGFKASLALALGLADVIQNHAGGVRIETMFIDEGFGTLDPASLDGAVDTLMRLKNDGRLVGVISHVPELRERIPARIEIVPSKSGSSIRMPGV